MDQINTIPSPSSPEELERIVEDIYQEKPWEGVIYFIVSPPARRGLQPICNVLAKLRPKIKPQNFHASLQF